MIDIDFFVEFTHILSMCLLSVAIFMRIQLMTKKAVKEMKDETQKEAASVEGKYTLLNNENDDDDDDDVEKQVDTV